MSRVIICCTLAVEFLGVSGQYENRLWIYPDMAQEFPMKSSVLRDTTAIQM